MSGVVEKYEGDLIHATARDGNGGGSGAAAMITGDFDSGSVPEDVESLEIHVYCTPPDASGEVLAYGETTQVECLGRDEPQVVRVDADTAWEDGYLRIEFRADAAPADFAYALVVLPG